MNGRRTMGRTGLRAVVLLTGALVTGALVAGVLLTGCSIDRQVAVEAGGYAVARNMGTAGTAAALEVRRLEIDREAGWMAFTLVDGSQIATTFVARARPEWPTGCPTNIQSTRMEVLEIAEDPLRLGSTTFDQPVLVRDCPAEPVRLVLRQDGEIGGGGTACLYGEPCLYFVPEVTTWAPGEPLPHQAKGYELYSREVGQRWQFALMTGTNRLKTYEEIVSGENVVSEDGWVAVSAQGVEELSAVLGRLPRGETVTWWGGGWLERAGTASVDLQLPGLEVVEEVEAACRELGIELVVAD